VLILFVLLVLLKRQMKLIAQHYERDSRVIDECVSMYYELQTEETRISIYYKLQKTSVVVCLSYESLKERSALVHTTLLIEDVR
jgi:hypothetical protein